MSFSVIHFSDIHIQTASDLILNRVDRIKQACVSALPGEGIVAIAISGDIAYSGKDGQYALANSFRLETELPQEGKLRRNQSSKKRI